GPDLFIDLSVSDTTPSVGDSVALAVNITNIGEENVTGYNFSLYAGSTELITTEYNDTLAPNSTRNITYFWTATSGVTYIRANVSTATTQCLLTNDEENVSITVFSGGGGGGGGGGTTTVVEDGVTDISFYEIINFPKTLYGLDAKDKIKIKIDDKWYTMIIEDVSDDKVATTMAWEGKYYVFEEGDEKIFEINHYKLFIELENVDEDKATFSFDLIKELLLDAILFMPNEFEPGSNVSYEVEFESDADILVDSVLFKMNKQVWSKSSELSDSGSFEEILGELEEGTYYLYLTFKSGKEVKEIEKEFTVGEEQVPLPVSDKFDLQDLLILLLICLISVVVILTVKFMTDRNAEEEDEAEEEEETGDENVGESSQKTNIIQKIGDSVAAIFALFKKEKTEEVKEEEQGEKEVKQKKIPSVDFVGKKGDVYLPHNNLLKLKQWLQEYHESQHITHKMKRMPEVVQQIGPKVYEEPKDVTNDDVVRLTKLFKEKHDYISYNDLVIGGSVITRELKKTLGEEEQKKPVMKPVVKGKHLVKYYLLREIDDVKEMLDSLRKGSIVIVNLSPIYKSNKKNLKRAVDKLKNTCDALGGEVALTFNRHLIVTPRKNIEIFRTHEK
ncbi:cell division protein SepF, partial [Candidatus Woesearchaeota archaeon]|nr:cell division protein SepF [Candidatus Woesearchaeota archaeon]